MEKVALCSSNFSGLNGMRINNASTTCKQAAAWLWAVEVKILERQKDNWPHTRIRFVCSRSLAIASICAVVLHVFSSAHTDTFRKIETFNGAFWYLALYLGLLLLWCALGLMQTLIKLIIVCGYTLSTIDINKRCVHCTQRNALANVARAGRRERRTKRGAEAYAIDLVKKGARP